MSACVAQPEDRIVSKVESSNKAAVLGALNGFGVLPYGRKRAVCLPEMKRKEGRKLTDGDAEARRGAEENFNLGTRT